MCARTFLLSAIVRATTWYALFIYGCCLDYKEPEPCQYSIGKVNQDSWARERFIPSNPEKKRERKTGQIGYTEFYAWELIVWVHDSLCSMKTMIWFTWNERDEAAKSMPTSAISLTISCEYSHSGWFNCWKWQTTFEIETKKRSIDCYHKPTLKKTTTLHVFWLHTRIA